MISWRKQRQRPESLNEQDAEGTAGPGARAASGPHHSRPRPISRSAPENCPRRTAQARLLFPRGQPRRGLFRDTTTRSAYTDFWVSDLALVVATRAKARSRASCWRPTPANRSRAPKSMAWYLDRNGNRVQRRAEAGTDDNGFFSFKPEEQARLSGARAAQGQELASTRRYCGLERGPGQPRTDTAIFFTDRALYRPGQTIQYKGIALHVDQEKDNYEVLAGRQRDRGLRRSQRQGNRQGRAPLQRLRLASAAASPRRATGSWAATRSRSQRRAGGGHWFNVEEYKRPKFQVTLEAPKTAPKLNDDVVAAGQGRGLHRRGGGWRAGEMAGGARSALARLVGLVGLARAARAGRSQEIAHGTATHRHGRHVQDRVHRQARSAGLGEGRSLLQLQRPCGRDGHRGRNALGRARRQRGLRRPARQRSARRIGRPTTRPSSLKLDTTTLDGEPQIAEGSLKIYRLKEPAAGPARAPAGALTAADDLADDQADADLSNPNNWELGDVAAGEGLHDGRRGQGHAAVQAGRPASIAPCSKPRTGSARKSPPGSRPGAAAERRPSWPSRFRTCWPRRSGSRSRARSSWRSGAPATSRAAPSSRSSIAAQMVQRFWTQPGVTQQQIKQAVTEAMRGGFTVHVTQVRENRAYLELAPRGRALEQQGPRAEVGTFHLQARAGPEGDLDAAISQSPQRVRSPRVGKGRGRDGGDALRRVARPYLPHDWLRRSASSTRTTAPLRRTFAN